VALAAVFSLVVPPWEAHDEIGHAAYVDAIVRNRALPDALSGEKVFFDQSHQPPLYYAASAALTGWLARGDSAPPEVNLFAFDGTNRKGARIVLRQPGEAFPWSAPILILHAQRLVSVALSGLMAWLIATAAARLFTGRPCAALFAASIAVFNPQALFMAGMVNNDIMVSLAGAWLAYLIVAVACDPRPAPPDWRRFAPIGLALGIGLLAKNSALIFAPFAGAALLFIGMRQRWPARWFVRAALLVGLPAALLAAPWYLSNLARYGMPVVNRDPVEPILRAPAGVIGEGVRVSLRDGWLPQLFVNTFRTFWGAFGWGNVQMPDAAYWLFLLLCLGGIAGSLAGWRRADRATRTGLVALGLFGVAMLLLPGYRAIYYQSPALVPGRYLMPALAAYAAWLGFGWATVLGGKSGVDSRLSCAGLPVVLGLFALAVPFLFIAPVYAPPAIQPQPDAQPLLSFGQSAELIGVEAGTVTLNDREGPRQYARVRLAWRAMRPAGANYALGVSILGRDEEVLGTTNIHPAGGNFPTSSWQAGDAFVDEVLVLLEKPCARLPAMGRVHVSVFSYAATSPQPGTAGISVTGYLSAADAGGRPVAPIAGRFRIEEPAVRVPVTWQPPIGMLDGIALVQASLPPTAAAGTQVPVALAFETWRDGNREGVAFVHLLDAEGRMVAQDDHAPLGGFYPTDLWARGECVRDTFLLTVPPTATGVLRAVAGLYHPVDGARFRTGTPDDLIPIGEVSVTP
jgi:hypothetical protein